MSVTESTGEASAAIRWRTHLGIVVAIVAFFALWTLAYDQINRWVSPHATYYERPIDAYDWVLQPWTALIYVFGGYLIPWFPFLFNWNWRFVRFSLVAYGLVSVASFVVYLAWPIAIQRPPYDGGTIGDDLMRVVVSLDNPANCFPSGHTYFAILAALLVGAGAAPRWFKVATWVLGVAVAITTVTTGQHYVMDVPGGVAFAVAGYFAARVCCGPRKQPATPIQHPSTPDE